MKTKTWYMLTLFLLHVSCQFITIQAEKVKTAPDSLEANPNELGRVLILEYHLIGTPEGEWRRTPENFRKDLIMLYENGYYPVKLQDYMQGNINVPKGKTPFILTFDDSSAGQFTAVKTADGIMPTRDCAVGIMEAMKKEYPDFPLTATFFVLPGIKKHLRLFGQPELIKEKLTYLVKHGYEIGNHTLWHQNLRKASELEIKRQLALANKYIQEYLPGYEMKSLALPFGEMPENSTVLRAGEFEGIGYNINAVLLVSGGPALSVFHRDFNPMKIPRIQAGDTPYGPAAIISNWRKNPHKRFISDGDAAKITIPYSHADALSPKYFNKFDVIYIKKN